MASINSVVLRGGQVPNSRMQWLQMNVQCSFTDPEIEQDALFRLRGYVFEQDGNRDKHSLGSDGRLITETQGNEDDWIRNRGLMWDVEIRPSEVGQPVHEFPDIVVDIKRDHIHELQGEFYGVATIVPEAFSGDMQEMDGVVFITHR